MKFPDPVQIAVPFFILLIIIEMVAVKRGAHGGRRIVAGRNGRPLHQR